MSPLRFAILVLCLAGLAGPRPGEAGGLQGNCRLDDQPAATLLFPYFRVDLDDPAGATTLLSIGNSFSASAQARVVLWTDWGVPTLAFDVFLTGFDIQTVNMRDLFQGNLPRTGTEVSPIGPFSRDAPADGCDDPTPGTLAVMDRDILRAAHTGKPLPLSDPPLCAGAPGGSLAVGYVTVDVVNRCTPPAVGTSRNTPADPLYFSAGGRGLASDVNVLWGDSIEIDPDKSFAASENAVSIVADPNFFRPGDYTFYGRYVGFDTRDDRVPLSGLFQARLLSGGSFGGSSELVVWRDTREAAPAPRSCGTAPRWSPLGEAQIAFFDEEENPISIGPSNAFPRAVQRVSIGGAELPTDAPFGWAMLDLWHANLTHAQAWVGVRMNAEGRFWVGHRAIRADDLCEFGP
ncbi:MAG TPA: hypothetical protein VGS22_07615 [Thermoanaerobaculia bacterium]|jgi:hypothetical protein|nr:hypothetical protein [Thermoanaerobaculia bacterium]